MGDPIGVCVDPAFIEETYQQLTAEMHQHIPKLQAAQQMWSEARDWIRRQASLLLTQATSLTDRDRWPDAAGQAFLQRVLRDVVVMQSWVDPSGITGSMLSRGIPVASGVPASQVFDCLDALATGIRNAQATVEGLRNRYQAMSEKDKTKNLDEIYGKVVEQLNGLQPKYQAATDALHHAQGQEWVGPRGVAPSPSSSPGPAPGAAAPGAATPTSPAPGAAPSTPDSPVTPAAEDPIKAAMAEAPNALDAASQALQGLQQLAGGDSPSPTSLGSLTPAEVADRLSSLGDFGGAVGDSGLPSLAGGGAAPAGGGFPAAAPIPAPASDPGAMSTALPSTTAFGTAAGTTAAAASNPGMMMPPMQPRGAGGKAASEIRPGEAEHPTTGRSRGRKPGATPGVPLLGRAGRRGSKADPPPAARRRWDTENDTVQMLDEELWQVDKTDGAPRYRAGH